MSNPNQERIAVGYPRVSDRKQRRGESFDAQIARFYEYAKQNNIRLLKIYDKDRGFSASQKEEDIKTWIEGTKLMTSIELKRRKDFLEILKDALDKVFNTLLVFKWDRYARYLITQENSFFHLKQVDVDVIPTDDSKEKLYRRFMGAISEEETEKLKSRLDLTLMNKFNQGYLVGRPPYGYRLSKDKKNVIIEQEEAEIVREIFELTAKGGTYKEICLEFKLKPQSYYNIIRNKVYCGYVKYGGQYNKGKHIGIISEALFSDVNKRFGGKEDE